MSHQLTTSVLHIEVKLKKVNDAQYVRPDIVIISSSELILSFVLSVVIGY